MPLKSKVQENGTKFLKESIINPILSCFIPQNIADKDGLII